MNPIAALLLVLTTALGGCAAPLQLNLGPSNRVSLTSLPVESAATFKVVDGRTDIDRAGSRTAGLIWLSDSELEPDPAVAVTRELSRALNHASTALRSEDIQTSLLKTFDVAVQWSDFRNQGYKGGPPGMVAVDQLFRGLAQTGKQMTFALTVRIAVELNNVSYKAEASALHSSEQGPIQLQSLVRSATERIAEKIEAEHREHSGGQ